MKDSKIHISKQGLGASYSNPLPVEALNRVRLLNIGAWPHFVIDSHHVRFEDDAVMLGEELSNVADQPIREESLEGMAEGGGNDGAVEGGGDVEGAAGEAGSGAGGEAAEGEGGEVVAAGAEEFDFAPFEDGKREEVALLAQKNAKRRNILTWHSQNLG